MAAEAETLAPGLLRLVAPNPSPLTGEGTNSYVILGTDGAIVIDPGPEIPAHLDALLAAAGGAPAAILVTHSHRDHSPGATALRARTGAPVYAFGPTGAGRSTVMEALAAQGSLGGGEGADEGFRPSHSLADGDRLEIAGQTLTALHTPGHFGNHMCFAWQGALFSGDHVMAWASTLVSPPDGDLTDFMASCARLAPRNDRIYYPGHGAPVTDPAARLDWLMAHRRSREAQIRAALATAPGTPAALTERVYMDVAPHLWPAAERNVLAHLIDLAARGLATPEGPLSATAIFHPA